jgi:hypothetical protein
MAGIAIKPLINSRDHMIDFLEDFHDNISTSKDVLVSTLLRRYERCLLLYLNTLKALALNQFPENKELAKMSLPNIVRFCEKHDLLDQASIVLQAINFRNSFSKVFLSDLEDKTILHNVFTLSDLIEDLSKIV